MSEDRLQEILNKPIKELNQDELEAGIKHIAEGASA